MNPIPLMLLFVAGAAAAPADDTAAAPESLRVITYNNFSGTSSWA
jgi:hypothetical protein